MAATAAATAMPVASASGWLRCASTWMSWLAISGALHHLEHRAHVLDAAVRHLLDAVAQDEGAPERESAGTTGDLDRDDDAAASPTSPVTDAGRSVRLAHHRAFHAEVEAREAPLDLLRRDLLFEASGLRSSRGARARWWRTQRARCAQSRRRLRTRPPSSRSRNVSFPVSPLRRCASRTILGGRGSLELGMRPSGYFLGDENCRSFRRFSWCRP